MNQIETLAYNLRKKAPRTTERYLGICRQFLAYAQEDFSRLKMLQFLESKEHEWEPNTRRLAHYALSKLCKSLEIHFPLDADDLPFPPSRSELQTPFLEHDEVARLIGVWRDTPSYERSLLWLSTTYGCRSLEMTDIEVGKGFLVVGLAKKRGGRRLPKQHLIPDGCTPFLEGYSHQTEFKVIAAFHKIARTGLVSKEYGAWHMVRRSLNTELQLGGINPEVLTRFIGWEKSAIQQGASPMASIYFHLKDGDIDRMVFEKHPYLSIWRT